MGWEGYWQLLHFLLCLCVTSMSLVCSSPFVSVSCRERRDLFCKKKYSFCSSSHPLSKRISIFFCQPQSSLLPWEKERMTKKKKVNLAILSAKLEDLIYFLSLAPHFSPVQSFKGFIEHTIQYLVQYCCCRIWKVLLMLTWRCYCALWYHHPLLFCLICPYMLTSMGGGDSTVVSLLKGRKKLMVQQFFPPSPPLSPLPWSNFPKNACPENIPFTFFRAHKEGKKKKKGRDPLFSDIILQKRKRLQ